MDRRDFLVTMLRALFLALFPWLRTERGAEVVKAAAEKMVADRAVFKDGTFQLRSAFKGFDVDCGWWANMSPEIRDAVEKLAVTE
jgi:hypothetical protein